MAKTQFSELANGEKFRVIDGVPDLMMKLRVPADQHLDVLGRPIFENNTAILSGPFAGILTNIHPDMKVELVTAD